MRFKNGSLLSISALSAIATMAACSSAIDEDPSTTENLGTVSSAHRDDAERVHASVVAAGIPGAGAVLQVGAFHRSSPLHDRASFQPYVAPGAVLNGARLLVTSSSNFGAPKERADQYEGSVLSIESTASNASIPGDFAAAGDQATTAGGAVTVYSANNHAFLNSRFNPGAVTANEVGASLPTGLSINNGNGRPWVSNAPYGAAGYGTISVLDPQGSGLAGPPSPVAAGEFAGTVTNRPGAIGGLNGGSLGTAILSKSSDGTGRAVFVSINTDGSISQIHVQKGVDQLSPPGTLPPVPTLTPAMMESTNPHTYARMGVAFNWAPKRVLYVADPKNDRVAIFDLTDDGTLFIAPSPRYFANRHGRCGSDTFDVPIDVAPTIPEVASENFSSNTTLAVGADLYVLNRGNNSIVRITQEGDVVAKRSIVVDGHPSFRANGMGVSPDGRTIWVTGQTANHGGVVVGVPGFGAGPIMPGLMSQAGTGTTEHLGEFFFTHDFTRAEGVGPLFNAQGCAGCHNEGAGGSLFVGGMSSSIFETIFSGGHGGPTAREHSINELGGHCGLPTGAPPNATATSLRSTPTLRSTSLIDFVLPTEILKNRDLEPADVRGRPNILADGRIGRFGWKANVATLTEFMGDAFRNEQGLTNGLVRRDQVNGCQANRITPELDAVPLVTVPAFLATVDAPAPTAACTGSAGAAVFQSTGCQSCHTASFPGPGFAAFLYSDLLLHDMGPGLADGLQQESATGSEFRTMTLVKLNERTHFLHDGRAATPTDAILAHGGQAAASATAFSALSATDKQALLDFLGCL